MTTFEWILLTQGDRPDALGQAVDSIRSRTTDSVVVVNNGGPAVELPDGVEILTLPSNLGVPGGRAAGVARSPADIVCFLDDDATLDEFDRNDLQRQFDDDPQLAVVGFRLVDELGDTARRHVPRVGTRRVDRSGSVATFLGGACAVRRSAYDAVGGFWGALHYGHEELDLSWRLIDAGHRVAYDPTIVVFHPRTEIGRHPTGWWHTGRNRVWVARRDLPWPVALIHVTTWLLLGLRRAPRRDCRRSYAAGWRHGWSEPVPRDPIRWKTVWRLTRLGRPPVI